MICVFESLEDIYLVLSLEVFFDRLLIQETSQQFPGVHFHMSKKCMFIICMDVNSLVTGNPEEFFYQDKVVITTYEDKVCLTSSTVSKSTRFRYASTDDALDCSKIRVGDMLFVILTSVYLEVERM